jgi:hypothetical protein
MRQFYFCSESVEESSKSSHGRPLEKTKNIWGDGRTKAILVERIMDLDTKVRSH